MPKRWESVGEVGTKSSSNQTDPYTQVVHVSNMSLGGPKGYTIRNVLGSYLKMFPESRILFSGDSS